MNVERDGVRSRWQKVMKLDCVTPQLCGNPKLIRVMRDTGMYQSELTLLIGNRSYMEMKLLLIWTDCTIVKTVSQTIA